MSGKDLMLGLLLGLMIGVGGWGIIQFGFAKEEEVPPCTGETMHGSLSSIKSRLTNHSLFTNKSDFTGYYQMAA